MIRNITQKGNRLIITEKNGSQCTYNNVSHYAFVDIRGGRQISEREFQNNGGKILIVYTNGKSEFYIDTRIKSSNISSNARDAGGAAADIVFNILSRVIKWIISKLVARFGKKRVTIAFVLVFIIFILWLYIEQ